MKLQCGLALYVRLGALRAGDGEGVRRVEGDGGLRGDGDGAAMLGRAAVHVAQKQWDARSERH